MKALPANFQTMNSKGRGKSFGTFYLLTLLGIRERQIKKISIILFNVIEFNSIQIRYVVSVTTKKIWCMAMKE